VSIPKPGKNKKCPQNLHSISLLSNTGKFFEKVIVKMVKWHIEETGLLNASQFGFCACHKSTLKCMTLNFSNNICTATVFLHIETAFNKTRHPGILHKSYKLKCSSNLMNLIHSFQSKRKIAGSVEGNMYTPKEIQTQMPQDSVLTTTLYSRYMNDIPKIPVVYLTLFVGDACMYTTDCIEDFVSEHCRAVSVQLRHGV
jgi:hypothetical protein